MEPALSLQLFIGYIFRPYGHKPWKRMFIRACSKLCVATTVIRGVFGYHMFICLCRLKIMLSFSLIIVWTVKLLWLLNS